MLAEGRLSVGDVAARLGFNNPSTFYRAFRKAAVADGVARETVPA